MVSDRLRLSRRRRSRCDSECECVRRAAHGALGRESVLACLPSVLRPLVQNRRQSRRSVCTRLPEAHSGALEWRGDSTAYGASSRRADKAAKLRRRARFVRLGGLQTRQGVRDARRRRGADTTKRTTTIGRYSSARPETTQTSKEPSGSRPRSPPAPGPLVNRRPSSLRRAP